MNPRLLAPVIAAALLVSACGGDSSDDAAPAADSTTTTAAASSTTTGAPGSTEAPDSSSTTAAAGDDGGSGQTLADIAPLADSEESARFEATMTMVPAAESAMTEPMVMTMSGSLDPAADAVQLSMDMRAIIEAAMAGQDASQMPPGFAEMFAEPMESITIAETSWLRHPMFGMMLGAEEGQWIEVSSEDSEAITGGLGMGNQVTSPNAFLQQFRDAEAEVEELGTETIHGTETTHYRLIIDVESMSQDLSPEEQAELEQQFGALDELPVEVWIDDEGRLHRYRTELAGAAMQGEAAEIESVTVDVTFSDHGADVVITPPPPEQVTKLDDPGAGLGMGTEGEG